MESSCKFVVVLRLLTLFMLCGSTTGDVNSGSIYSLLSHVIFEMKANVEKVEKRMEIMEDRLARVETVMSTTAAKTSDISTIGPNDEIDLNEVITSQALVIKNTLLTEKKILRETMHSFAQNFSDFKSEILTEMSAFSKALNMDISTINASLESKEDNLIYRLNSSSIVIANKVIELTSSLNSTTSEISLVLEEVRSSIEGVEQRISAVEQNQSVPKVDGGWSTWGSWSECFAVCGTGMASRNRSCCNPEPSNGGDHCFGDSTEYQLCYRLPCPDGKHRNCKDLMDTGDNITGFKIVLPDGINPIRVLCVMDVEGGGWAVFQKRESASDFYKNWQEYRNGFGDDTNFWLGLENIHRLTAQGNYELRIDMMRTNNQSAAAKYQIFSVGNETMLYKLLLGRYSYDPAFDDPGDAFLYHNGMKFTTLDKDNDKWSDDNCAVYRKGGWWYNDCVISYLNGVYGSGMYWSSWTGWYESLKNSRMMIRPT